MVNPLGRWTCASLAFVGAFSLAQSAPLKHPPNTEAATVGACTFKFSDSLGGRLTGDVHGTPPYAVYRVELNRKSLPAAFHIRFGCDTRDPTKVCREVVGVEHTQNGWVAWESPDKTPLPEDAHIEVRELRSVNGFGAVRLQSDTTGNEERRARTLGFCLTSPYGATLSGVTFIDALFGKHKSVEPDVMKLLRSINFTGQNAFNSDTAELERRNQ